VVALGHDPDGLAAASWTRRPGAAAPAPRPRPRSALRRLPAPATGTAAWSSAAPAPRLRPRSRWTRCRELGSPSRRSSASSTPPSATTTAWSATIPMDSLPRAGLAVQAQQRQLHAAGNRNHRVVGHDPDGLAAASWTRRPGAAAAPAPPSATIRAASSACAGNRNHRVVGHDPDGLAAASWTRRPGAARPAPRLRPRSRWTRWRELGSPSRRSSCASSTPPSATTAAWSPSATIVMDSLPRAGLAVQAQQLRQLHAAFGHDRRVVALAHDPDGLAAASWARCRSAAPAPRLRPRSRWTRWRELGSPSRRSSCASSAFGHDPRCVVCLRRQPEPLRGRPRSRWTRCRELGSPSRRSSCASSAFGHDRRVVALGHDRDGLAAASLARRPGAARPAPPSATTTAWSATIPMDSLLRGRPRSRWTRCRELHGPETRREGAKRRPVVGENVGAWGRSKPQRVVFQALARGPRLHHIPPFAGVFFVRSFPPLSRKFRQVRHLGPIPSL
jgi:hypothetical protein